MQKAIIGIGLPGAGKTTVLRNFAAHHNYAYISIDQIRTELTGDIGDNMRTPEVWDLARQKTSDLIKNGETIVFDATFKRQHNRRDFITWLRREGVRQVQGLYISTPIEVARERNSLRERPAPDEIIELTHKLITESPPDIADGFDSLFVLNKNHELTRVEIAREERTLRKEMRIRNK